SGGGITSRSCATLCCRAAGGRPFGTKSRSSASSAWSFTRWPGSKCDACNLKSNEKAATKTLQPATQRPGAEGIQPDQASSLAASLYVSAAGAAVVALRLRVERQGEKPESRRG